MSVYSIDYSEPLKLGFEIPAGGYDGPGAAASHTSLRLHGRGALEWGEAVNEDLVRLTENFASASPPINRLTGQMWVELKLYHHNGGGVFKRFDMVAGTWGAITVGTTQPVSPTRGTYWWDGTTLWGYYEISTVGTSAMDWRPRSFSSGGTIADGATSPAPQQIVNVFNAQANAGAGAWVPPQAVTASATDPSATSTPTPGTLWYDSSTGTLNVWDQTLNGGLGGWSTLVTAGAVSSGNIDMGGLYTVTNLAAPVNAGDAATKSYVDTSSVSITGDTMTGALILNADPSVALGAATKQYVDAAVGTLSGINTSTVYADPVGSFAYNAGDIAVAAGKIYIAVAAGTSACPGGNWKQVWPATYS